MSYRVRYTKAAKDDLKRLYACRKVMADNHFLREFLISFGNSGYVALFEIEEKETVTVLAVRHQREEDYH